MSIRLVARSIWCNPGNRGRRFRKSCAAVIWQLRKRILRAPRVVRLVNGVLFQVHPDCVISSSLVYADWPEFLALTFVRQQLRPGEAVLDIGANVGHISLLLADIAGPTNLHCFEPAPVSFARLKANWELNAWKTDQLWQVAVGAHTGSARIAKLERPMTTNSIVTSTDPLNSIKVKLIRLDDYRSWLGGRQIGLLKVDVEGYEPEVFRGGESLILLDRPRLIMFECLGHRVPRFVCNLLQRARYRVFRINEAGQAVSTGPIDQNMFAAPEEEFTRLIRTVPKNVGSRACDKRRF